MYDTVNHIAIASTLTDPRNEDFWRVQTRLTYHGIYRQALADIAQRSPHSWLFDLARRIHVGATPKLAPGGLERSLLAAKYPAADMIAIGPSILDAHSPRERVAKASVLRLEGVVDRLLVELGLCRAQVARTSR